MAATRASWLTAVGVVIGACSSAPEPELGPGGSDANHAVAGSSGNGASGSSAAGTAGGGGSASAAGAGGTPSDAAGGAPSDGASDSSTPGVGCTGAVLCWDFEEGRMPAGFTRARNEFMCELLVDSARPRSGNYSLHAKDLRGGTPGTAGGPKKSVRLALPAGFGPVFWGRMFVYSTPSRPMSHAGLFSARYPRPGSSATEMN